MSWWIVLAVVAAVAAGVMGRQLLASRPGAVGPWFAGYVDVTATPAFGFESPEADSVRDVVLSFIVSAPNEPCTPTWGTALTMDEASTRLDLDGRIARLKEQGGGVAVSFGGQVNHELATTCTDVRRLTAAYASVIDRYHVATIDLDLEGRGLGNHAAGQRRAQAIKKLQQDRMASGRPFVVWLTLPTSTNGLTANGRAAVADMLGAGVDLAGVNAMTMDFGASRAHGQSMLQATTSALTATQRQLDTLYRRAGIELPTAALWSKLGVTPMIGQNDVPDEVFSLDAAKGLNELIHSHGIGRASVWSLNRDKACGPNHPEVGPASSKCSGVSQGHQEFADLLSVGMSGRLTPS